MIIANFMRNQFIIFFSVDQIPLLPPKSEKKKFNSRRCLITIFFLIIWNLYISLSTPTTHFWPEKKHQTNTIDIVIDFWKIVVWVLSPFVCAAVREYVCACVFMRLKFLLILYFHTDYFGLLNKIPCNVL